MAAEWICDGCGKRTPGVIGAGGDWLKPPSWYEKTVFDGEDARPFGQLGRAKTTLSACSRECIRASL